MRIVRDRVSVEDLATRVAQFEQKPDRRKGEHARGPRAKNREIPPDHGSALVPSPFSFLYLGLQAWLRLLAYVAVSCSSPRALPACVAGCVTRRARVTSDIRVT